MRLFPTLPPLAVFVLGLILLFGAGNLVRGWAPAMAQPAQHGQSLEKGDDKSSSGIAGPKKGGAAGNGASGSGRTEAILVAEVLALLVVGRALGEGMQRLGQPALMGPLLA